MSALKLREFKDSDYLQFQENMGLEIEHLQNAIAQSLICDNGTSFGAEIEAWITDSGFQPNPRNLELLRDMNHPQYVPELSQYNVEYNSGVHRGGALSFKNIEEEFQASEEKLNQVAELRGNRVLMIGTMPTLSIDKIGLPQMTPRERYHIVNQQIMSKDHFAKREFEIEGKKDKLHFFSDSIMPVAATTSFQIHYKMPYSEFAGHYNASYFGAGVLVALSANSPFLFGKELWEESRIPLFEQSVGKNSRGVSRVGLGYGYLDGEVCEYYKNILRDYNVYYPEVLPFEPGQFRHNNMHNGTIWHWNRVVIGKENDFKPYHARIEFRPCSSGPTAVDMVAHMALYIGLTRYLSHQKVESLLSFSQVSENFYACAKNGLEAEVWNLEGKKLPVAEYLQVCIDMSQKGLQELGVEDSEIQYYLYDVLLPRVRQKRNGASWQRECTQQMGGNFAKMLDLYWQQQRENKPLHLWDL